MLQTNESCCSNFVTWNTPSYCPFCAPDPKPNLWPINHQKQHLYSHRQIMDHMADETAVMKTDNIPWFNRSDFKACLSDRYVEVIWTSRKNPPHTHCKENSSEGESWDTCGDAGSITGNCVCWFAHARRRGGDSAEPSGPCQRQPCWTERKCGLEGGVVISGKEQHKSGNTITQHCA